MLAPHLLLAPSRVSAYTRIDTCGLNEVEKEIGIFVVVLFFLFFTAFSSFFHAHIVPPFSSTSFFSVNLLFLSLSLADAFRPSDLYTCLAPSACACVSELYLGPLMPLSGRFFLRSFGHVWAFSSAPTDRVSQTLELLSQKIANRVFGRFPALAEKVLELSQEILLRERDHTKTILQQIVDAETGYLFTNDPRYLSEHGSMISQDASDPMNPGGGGGGGPGGSSGGAMLTSQQSGGGSGSSLQLYSADGRPVQLGPDGRPIPQPTHAERAHQMFTSVQQTVSNIWTSQPSRDKKKTVYSGKLLLASTLLLRTNLPRKYGCSLRGMWVSQLYIRARTNRQTQRGGV